MARGRFNDWPSDYLTISLYSRLDIDLIIMSFSSLLLLGSLGKILSLLQPNVVPKLEQLHLVAYAKYDRASSRWP